MSTGTSTIELTIGHSPDPDDAFMWWPLGSTAPAHAFEPAIDTGRFRFQAVPEDIQALNLRAMEVGDLDVTAVSMHALAHVADRYALARSGSSMGDGYGPRVVAAAPRDRAWLDGAEVRFAVPGEQTSAFLALRLMLGRAFEFAPMRFDAIPEAVRSGEVDAGVVIHQSQITYADEGLHLVADLGAWWGEETGLPLPLGANAVRTDLDERFGPGVTAELSALLRRSIEHAMAEREQSLAAAAVYEPDLPPEIAGRFVDMYVNELTLDLGERGEHAVHRFLAEAASIGVAPAASGLRVI